MADLILVPRDGCAISGSATGDDFVVPVMGSVNRGYHGYVASNSKMNALFIAAGRGILRDGKIGMVDNVDVAPTIAHLLGQKLANVDGKIMTSILVESK